MATSVTNAATLDAAADGLAAVITHWGLVDTSGTELTGGSYARIASAGVSNLGTVKPTGNLAFNVPAATTVGGVRAYSASSGGTNFGGWDYPTGAGNGRETFDSAGTYTVIAATSGFTVT